MASDYIRLGEIVKPQGIRGEVKVHTGGDAQRLAQLDTVYLEEGVGHAPRRVLKGRAGGGFAFLLLEGVDDRNAAEALRGRAVYARREDAQLGEDENFVSDLIGLSAVDTQGNALGTLRDVLKPNAVCDVYVFDTPRGELMIPALRRVVAEVDVDGGRIVLDERVLPEVAVWEDEASERDD